jgi:mannose-1-phosphate guanylyltransferase
VADTHLAIRHVLLLTAGLGTRLMPLTSVRAKPAIPIGGEPIVRHIARWLAAGGVTELLLNLHHRPETIARVMGDGSDLGVRVRYSWEQPAVLGSAGGPRLALPIIGAETFFIVNGDTLTNISLHALAEAHRAAAMPAGDAVVTLALIPNEEPLRYGGILLDGESRVTGFVRRGPAAVGSFHFVGVQAVNAGAFAWLPAGEPFSSIGYAYDRLIAEFPGSIRGFVTSADFQDIGTVADYVRTSRAYPARVGSNVRAHPSSRVSNTIIWDNVEIGPDCTLDECIVTDDVVLPAGAAWRRMILMNGPAGVEACPIDAV